MLTVVCFLWFDRHGRHNNLFVYTADYVNRLRSMLARNMSIAHELVCVTDNPKGLDSRIRVVDLPPEVKAFGDLFPKLYFWHPDGADLFGARTLLMDLDAVITGPMDDLLSGNVPLKAWATNENDKSRFNTSMVLKDGGAYSEVFARFDYHQSRRILIDQRMAFGDQEWASLVLANTGMETWPRRGGGIEPYYQIQAGRLPVNARVVFFNGRRSPEMSQLQKADRWIEEHWR